MRYKSNEKSFCRRPGNFVSLQTGYKTWLHTAATFHRSNECKMARRKFLPSAPNKTLWVVAIIFGILGILAHYVHLDELSHYNYEMLLIGFVLLAIGTTYRKT